MRKGSVSYSRLADRYETLRGGDERAVQIADALVPWLPDAGLVCDVGAGTGVVTERLAAGARPVIGCDLSHSMLSKGSARLPGRLCAADAMSLPFPSGRFDALTYVFVLHHVGDLAASLAEARRVLRAAGRIVSISGIFLPSDDDLSPAYERLNEALRPERRDQALAVASVGRDIGLTVTHEGHATLTYTISPNELAQAIEERYFSHLWDLSDEMWEAHVAPVLADLRALPDPDQRRERLTRHPLVVLER